MDPTTEAGRSLLRQWLGHENEPEVRIVVLAIEDQARAAAAASVPLPVDGLDVERLARAIGRWIGGTPASVVVAIAAEYARLQSEPSTEDPT